MHWSTGGTIALEFATNKFNSVFFPRHGSQVNHHGVDGSGEMYSRYSWADFLVASRLLKEVGFLAGFLLEVFEGGLGPETPNEQQGRS